MRQRNARGVFRTNTDGVRRTPWTPIYNNSTGIGAIGTGNSPTLGKEPTDAVGITDTVVDELVPSTPSLSFVGRVTDATYLNSPDGIAASDDDQYLFTVKRGGSPDYVSSWDVSDPSTPTFEDADNSLSFQGPSNLAKYGSDYLVVEAGLNVGSIYVVDISDPTAVQVVGSTSDATNFFNSFLGVAVIGSNAFISGNEKLGTVSLSTPSSPSFTNVATDATNYDLATGYKPLVAFEPSGGGEYLVMAADDQLTVVDVSSPNSPSVEGTLTNGTYFSTIQGVDVDVTRELAVVIDQVTNYLTVVDLSDPTTPAVDGALDLGTYDPLSLQIIGNYVVVAGSGGGDQIRLYDITDSTDPTEISSYEDAYTPNTWHMCQLGSDMVAMTSTSEDTITILQIA